MSNLLVQGSVPIAAGAVQSAVVAIPVTLRRPGLAVMVSFQAEQFPVGITSIGIFLSTDGGATYHSAAMTVDNPAFWKGPPPHWWTLSLSLKETETPDHAFYRTNAPSAFTTVVKIEVG